MSHPPSTTAIIMGFKFCPRRFSFAFTLTPPSLSCRRATHAAAIDEDARRWVIRSNEQHQRDRSLQIDIIVRWEVLTPQPLHSF